MSRRSSFLFLSALSLFALTACGSAPPEDPTPSEENPRDEGEPSGLLPGQSGDFCRAPTPELSAFRPLDKALLVQTLGDSLVGWMGPLHASLLPLDEARFFETIFEAILGTFDTACKPERDLEFLPPEDDLIDPEAQSDVRASIADLFEDAVVVPTEDPTVLRLSIHECVSCGEPIGLVPSFLTARLTDGGVLALEYEFTEGTSWTKHVYVTPNSVVFEGELAPLSDWTDTLSTSTRDGSLRYPNATGKLSAFVTRTPEGKLSASLGVSGFSFETANDRPVRLAATTPCVGFYGELDREASSASFGLYTGDLALEMPGSSHCPNPNDCTPAESEGVFSYRAGDLTLTAEHPTTGSESVARFGLASKAESTMTAPGGVVGVADFGHDAPENDSFTVDLSSTPEGIRVAFAPVFDLRAALTLSSLSEAFRADLPDWLSDEIFDLSFGGDPKPSLLVPHRAACAVDPEPVYRRLVEVEAGTVHGIVGAGRDESATVGQCLGQTRRPTDELAFTSEWVEVLVCE